MANNIMTWIDKRFPLTSFVKHELTGYPTPRNLSYWWNFGFLAGIILMLQVATGIFLAMHYKADVGLSFDSIQHIMRDVNYGWLLRYMHATGASAFFFVIFVHMARTLYYGSFRAPRELLWWTGQGLLLMLMATAFMGYLLPWGQMSFWGATVITNLFRVTPFFGEQVVMWLRGDFTVGDATLTRFFSLHYLFPFLIIGGVIVHLVALHSVKSSNPSGIDLADKDNIPFHPYFTIKDLYGLGVFLMVYSVFVFFMPDSLIEPANNIPANPMMTPNHIVPEWYFLPFYAILRSVPNMVGGVLAMGLSVMMFAFMPFLDRSRIPGGAHYRPIYRLQYYLFLIDMLVLGYVGYMPPTSSTIVIVGQVATFCYFASFFVVPFISKAEERWLIKRGLPADIVALMEREKIDLDKRDSENLRRKGDK
jgi:ubiquinol-cytochrome c reductase cytochrome b subunit